uniref:Uncharacterized protein n=1 Tax=Oryza brachyantha TaxID=4533 RepID=J3NDX4_ORYBR
MHSEFRPTETEFLTRNDRSSSSTRPFPLGNQSSTAHSHRSENEEKDCYLADDEFDEAGAAAASRAVDAHRLEPALQRGVGGGIAAAEVADAAVGAEPEAGHVEHHGRRFHRHKADGTGEQRQSNLLSPSRRGQKAYVTHGATDGSEGGDDVVSDTRHVSHDLVRNLSRLGLVLAERFHDLKTNKNNYLSKCSGKRKQTKPSNLQLQLAKTAPHHRHSRRRTEPHFNLQNNLLLTQALALALVGEKLSKAEYKPPYSTSNTQERKNNACNRVSRIG